MTVERVLTPDQQIAMLREFLATDAVRDRPEGLQRDHDALIARAFAEEDVGLAMALWCVMAMRSAGLASEAAGAMLGLMASREVSARVREVLGTNRVN